MKPAVIVFMGSERAGREALSVVRASWPQLKVAETVESDADLVIIADATDMSHIRAIQNQNRLLVCMPREGDLGYMSDDDRFNTPDSREEFENRVRGIVCTLLLKRASGRS